MNLTDIAPQLGITCLVLQTIIAVILFFKHRRSRNRASALQRRNDALTVDNMGLRTQNVRLIQTVARLRGDIREAEKMCKDFNPEKE